ncbi:MAG: GyrI-like domain-containing protein, partial [Azonexus sp.]|nr:GyrI-like domain-containing protein [Azonexus sp.]
DLGGRDCYGIGHDDPRVSDPAQCRYDASVAVPEHFVPEGPVSITTLPGGCYAQWRYWGDGPGIARAWQTLRRDWLPQSGLRIDNRPCFEWMPAGSDYDPKTGEFACLICIPVQSE